MIDTYLKLYIDSPLSQGSPFAILVLAFLFLARMLPIIALSPFFGSRVLPHPVKVTFALSLFIIFLPHLLLVTTTPIGYNLMTFILFIKEILVGLVLGTLISVPFMIVQSAGILIDHQRGGASLMVNDPTIQNQSSPLGTLFNFLLIYIFFIMNGPFLFIDAILTSYSVIPPDKFLATELFSLKSAFAKVNINLLNDLMKLTVQLAAPALLTILMTDVFLGIVNRLAPQVQITFLGMPLKSLLGLGVICIGWRQFVQRMLDDSFTYLNVIDNVLGIFKLASDH